MLLLQVYLCHLSYFLVQTTQERAAHKEFCQVSGESCRCCE